MENVSQVKNKATNRLTDEADEVEEAWAISLLACHVKRSRLPYL